MGSAAWRFTAEHRDALRAPAVTPAKRIHRVMLMRALSIDKLTQRNYFGASRAAGPAARGEMRPKSPPTSARTLPRRSCTRMQNSVAVWYRWAVTYGVPQQ